MNILLPIRITYMHTNRDTGSEVIPNDNDGIRTMSSLIKLVLLVICMLGMVFVYQAYFSPPKDEAQVYRTMINKEFHVSLDQSNSKLEYSFSILSRDSVYIVIFDINEALVQTIESCLEWETKTDILLRRYLTPHQKYLEGIDEIIRSVKKDECFYKVHSTDEAPDDFKLVIINPNENRLFFVYITY